MKTPHSLMIFFTAAFLALTVSLAAGLREHRFRPGVFLPPLEKSPETTRFAWPFSGTVLEALRYAVWIIAGLSALAFLFSRGERRKLLWVLVPVMLAALITFLYPAPSEKEAAPQPPEVSYDGIKTGGDRVPAAPEAPEAEPLVRLRLPPWPFLLLLGGLVLAATFWFLWGRNRREVREKKEEVSFSPPSFPKPEGVVAQLWWRMVEILAARAGIAQIPKTRTARELAEVFSRRFPHPAIWELTELFEEVRYGEKSDAELASKARAALAKIEELG